MKLFLEKGGKRRRQTGWRRCAGRGAAVAALLLGALQVAGAADFEPWLSRMPITFTNETRLGKLTNHPALVLLSTNIPGFSYSRFSSPEDAADLRFTDATGTNELHYEIEKWDPWGFVTNITPASVTGLALWLRGDAGVLTNAGGAVTNWVDQSGLGNDANNFVSDPAIVNGPNGTAVIGFDADDYMYTTYNFDSLTAYTVITVARYEGGSAHNRVIGSMDHNWLHGFHDGMDDRWYYEGWIYGGGADNTNWHVHVATVTADADPKANVWKDGVRFVRDSTASHNTDYKPGRLSLNGFGGGELSNCEIGEVLIFDRVLKPSEIHAMSCYLTQRYNLATTYRASTAESSFWVRMPEFEPGTNIWMMWNNREVSAPPAYSLNGSAWESNFKGVWHLGGSTLDSTANANNGNNLGSVAAAGIVNGAQSFDGAGGHCVYCGGAQSLQFGAELTLNLWIAPTRNSGTSNAIVSLMTPWGNGDWRDYVYVLKQVNDQINFDWCQMVGEICYYGTCKSYGTIQSADVNHWTHVAVTYNSGGARIYKNGVQVGASGAAPYPPKQAGGEFRIGYCPSGNPLPAWWDVDGCPQPFSGLVDQVEAQGVTRSSNWVFACWLAQASNDTFKSCGAVTETGVTAPAINTATGAVAVLPNSAWLTATLTSTGTSAATVWSHWGTSNGGTNASAWTHSNAFGQNTDPVPPNKAYSNNASALTPGTVYYYTYCASNASGAAWATVRAFKTPGVPAVDNDGGASNVVAGIARLSGTLTDGVSADVFIYWGMWDGGTSTGAWQNVVSLGTLPEGLFATNVSGVLYGPPYFYRCYITNAYGAAWASETAGFYGAQPLAPAYAPGLWYGAIGSSRDWVTPNPCSQVTANLVETEEAHTLAQTRIFTGQIYDQDGQLALTENYDDSARVWVDGVQRIANDMWNQRTYTADLFLTPGWHDIEVRLANDGGAGGPPAGGSPGFGYDPGGGMKWLHPEDPGDGSLLRHVIGSNSASRISDLAATGIAVDSAVLNGVLSCSGAVFAVYVCWNTIDGGTNAELWANSAFVGVYTNMASTNVARTVSGLTGGGTYFYAFRATNAMEELWATNVLSFKTVTAPSIDNDGGALTNAVAWNAGLRGTLTAGTLGNVYVCWGTADGGTSTGAWQNVAGAGTVTEGPFSVTASGVYYGMTYYYRCYVSNAAGTAWAAETTNFAMPRPYSMRLPVTNGVQCWFDSAVGVTTNGIGTVTAWQDQSGRGRTASLGNHTPRLAQNQINNRPAVLFRGYADWLNVAGTFFAKEMYFVWRSATTPFNNYGGLLGAQTGRGSTFVVENGSTVMHNNQYPLALSRDGVAQGSPFNMAPVDSYMVMKVVVNDANTDPKIHQISRVDGMSFENDIAEIVAYDRTLSADEESRVGGYLAWKYGIPASYAEYSAPAGVSLVNVGVTNITTTSAVMRATMAFPRSVFNVALYWGTADGGTNAAAWTGSAYAGRFTNMASGDIACQAGDLSPNTLYFFAYRATNAFEDLWATNVMSFRTIGVPAVVNDGATSALGKATLLGTLTSGGRADIYVYWGRVDGGASTSGWQSVVSLGNRAEGSFSTVVAGLTYGVLYYYRCLATNEADAAWAPVSTAFTGARPPDSPVLGVTNGLVMWLDASRLTGVTDWQRLDVWTDVSGRGNNAVRDSGSPAGYPQYRVNMLNGKPVVRFSSAGGSWFSFANLTDVRTVFWVFRESTPHTHFALGDDTQCHFYRGADGFLWDSVNASAYVTGGKTKLMGSIVNGTTTALGTNYCVLSLVTAGNVEASRLSRDRGIAERSWDGDIAEVLIYNTALSMAAEREVGGYLAAKYGLTTAYSYVTPSSLSVSNTPATGITSTSAVINAQLKGTGSLFYVRAYWNTSNGGTNDSAWTNSAHIGVYTNASSTNLSLALSGLTSNTLCYFTFRATNAVENLWSASPLTFKTLGQPAVDNDGGATNVVAGISALRGTLTGGGRADVYVCWGAVDGGAVTSAWQSVCALGSLPEGSFATNAGPGLVHGLPYYYRCYASNAFGEAWASSSAAFTPISPSAAPGGNGLLLWLDAGSGVRTNAGGAVTNWADRSFRRNDASQEMPNRQPVPVYGALNGRPVVRFDDVDDGMDTTLDAKASYTAVVLFNCRVSGQGASRALQGTNNWLIGAHTGQARHFAGAWVDNATVGMTLNRFYLALARNDGTNSLFYVDGTNITGGNGVVSPGVVLLGYGLGGYQEPMGGDMAEVLFYNRALSAEECNNAGGYLARKYALGTAYYHPAFDVRNTDASGVTTASATLHADLFASESTVDVWAYWGAVNGGTNPAAWSGSIHVGSFTNVAATNLGVLASGLSADTTYFFAFRGVNAAGEIWTTNILAFSTAGVTIQATDPLADELGSGPAEFTVYRPAGLTNSDLRVYYSLGGTATHGPDYLCQTGSVVIPIGASSVTIPVTVFDEDDIEGTETIVATLVPAGYIVGSPGEAAVTIIDDDEPFRWRYRMPITLTSDSRMGVLTNFPLLVKFDRSSMPEFSYDQFAKTNAMDLRFSDGEGRAHLHYEVERWDTNGTSCVWVLVPLAMPGSNIWAYWGNSLTRAPFCATSRVVWTSSYCAVWHMNPNLGDSTTNLNQGTDQGSADTLGIAASGRSFDGLSGHCVYYGFGPSLQFGAEMTLNLWIAPAMNSGTSNAIISFTTPWGNWDWRDYVYALRQVNDRIQFDWCQVGASFYYGSCRSYGTIQSADVNQWTHVAVTYDGSGARIYKNGDLVATSGAWPYPPKQAGGEFRIGYCPSGNPLPAWWDPDGAPQPFSGLVDEVELQGLSRSSNWVWSVWANQKPGSKFAENGTVRVPGGGGTIMVH